MRNVVTVSAVILLLGFATVAQCQDQPASDALYTPDQLDNLLAPIALYPDPLLAQILVAATFPDQISVAARFVKNDFDPDHIDGQLWDVSVRAVAHYTTVVNMMSSNLDWTTALGQAYVNQPDDVMASVQRLRAEAEAAGNLQSNGQMDVEDDGGSIEIWPAQGEYIYAPEYDSTTIYFRHGAIYFGNGYPIGAWLNLDFNWSAHQVYYHGWDRTKGWATRSRPYLRSMGTYVNPAFSTVTVNRTVVNRNVNNANLGRFNVVHAPAPAPIRNQPQQVPATVFRQSAPERAPRQAERTPSPAPAQAPSAPIRTFERAAPAPRQEPVQRQETPRPTPPASRPAPEYHPAPPAPRPAPEYHPAPAPAPAPRPEPARSEPAHDDGAKKR